MRYRLENLNTAAELFVTVADRKTAHEIGQAVWPGEIVEVTTEREFDDLQIWHSHMRQVNQMLDDAYAMIPDSKYADILVYLQASRKRLYDLIYHFEARVKP